MTELALEIRQEMVAIVREAGSVARAGCTVKERIRYAAKVLRIDPGRARQFWYGRAARVEAYEADHLRQMRRLAIEGLIRRNEEETERLRSLLNA